MFHMVCLGGPNGENYSGILRMLDVLLSHEVNETEKRKVLQDEYGIQMTHTMEREVSVMCNLSKGVHEKGRAEGRAEGHAEGRAEGRVEGMTNGILSSIKNLMETMGLPMEQAMAALKVPETEKQKYIDLLEKQ